MPYHPPQVRGPYGLIESLERYVLAEGKEGSTLVVMGSLQMTSNVLDSVVVGLSHPPNFALIA